MARAEGIPARYVQGYCVPLGQEQTMIVTSSFAHAWPEVYIKNVGWIPFEPTPGYGELRYTPWTAKKGQKENPKEQFFKEQGEDVIELEKEEQEKLSKEFLAKLEEEREQQKKEQKKQLLKILLSSICSILAVGVLAICFERLISRYRYQKMTIEQKYLVQFKRNVKLLSKLGLTRSVGETIEEFRKRVMMKFSGEIEFYFLEMHEKFLYGTLELKEESIQLILEEQEKLLQILKSKRAILLLKYYKKGEKV